MENVPALADQAKTIRSFNSDCKIQVSPIHIPGKKNDEPIASAWGTAMVKSLALGGVDEANFALGRDATAAIDAMTPYAGQQLLQVETRACTCDSHPVDRVCRGKFARVGLFLVNRTAHVCHAEIDGITRGRR